jgi:short subunit dehydrogenase-like uncharacterized protein
MFFGEFSSEIREFSRLLHHINISILQVIKTNKKLIQHKMTEKKILLYGANGYTGKLIAKLATDYSLSPTLAGRNHREIKELADSLKLPFEIIDLNDTVKLDEIITQHSIVIHAAGPFSKTAKAMVESCIRNHVHYTDINGDISCFELVKKYNQDAIDSNCMLMPGVGFDVVPTDCIAKLLHQQMPDAIDLKIAFASVGSSVSHGTATTMAEKLGEKGAKRINGKIVRVPLGLNSMQVDFGKKKLFCMSIPWGDISTAFHTTGIQNIETFTAVKPSLFKQLRFQGLFNWLLRTQVVRKIIKQKIDQRPAGPDENMLKNGKCLVWGQVKNQKGDTKEARLSGPEGYSFTAHAALIIAKEIVNGNWQKGYQTPAGLYGYELANCVPGVSITLE